MVVRATDEPVHQRFVRLCLCSTWEPETLAAAEELATSNAFDWQAMVATAARNFVAPLLYHRLRHASWTPEDWLVQLRHQYLSWAGRNTLLFHELGRILQTLQRAGIPTLLLKGAALAESLYTNIALRPLRDLDLLVKPGDRRQAVDLLLPLGFAPEDAQLRSDAAFQYENEIWLMKPGLPGTQLELHWSLLDTMHHQQVLDMDWFWQTAVPVQREGHNTLALGSEAQLLHLCGHLALHHQGMGMLWFYDIALYLQKHGDALDWDELYRRAAAYDLVRPLQSVLQTLIEDWATPLPDDLIKGLAALQASEAEVRLYATHALAGQSVAERFRRDLAELPDWPAKVRFAWVNLFPSAAYMRSRYNVTNPFLLLLAYPYRLLIGLGDFVAPRTNRNRGRSSSQGRDQS